MKLIIFSVLFCSVLFCSVLSCGLYNLGQQPLLSNSNQQNSSFKSSPDTPTTSKRKSTTSRSRSRSRSNDDDDDNNDNDGNGLQADILHRITGSGLRIEDYLRTSVFLYTLIGECESSTNKATHKSCVEACLTTGGSGLRSCIRVCDNANSQACSTLGQACSGVFQQKNHILTNHHCIEVEIADYTDPTNNKFYYSFGTVVENHSGQRTTLKNIKWYDTTDDIALAELTASLSKAVVPTFGSVSDLSLLDELFTIGNPDSIKWTASLGELTNKNPPASLCRNCITHSIPVGDGNSGGPVFNHEGHLVALIAASLDGYDNVNFGPHIDRIKHLIRRSGSNDVTNLASRNSLLHSDNEDITEEIQDLVIYLWNL